MNKLFSYNLKQLIAFGAHLGHHTKKRAFFINNALLGHRNNIDIINLNKTIESLNLTIPIITEVINNSGKILFVADNANYLPNIIKDFKHLKQPILTKTWILGTLTNFTKTNHPSAISIDNLDRLPDLIVIINSTHPNLIIEEAKSMEIPVILFNDSNTNPQTSTYSIPTNDDSLDLTHLYLKIIKKTVLTAFAKYTLNFKNTILPRLDSNQ